MVTFKDDLIDLTTASGADRADARVVNEHAFFTVTQIAERWLCSPKKVRRLIAKGELGVYRFGALLRVSAPDLFTYERINHVA